MKYFDKKLKKIYKIALSIQENCSGVGSLTKTKSVAEEIIKSVQNFWKSKIGEIK